MAKGSKRDSLVLRCHEVRRCDRIAIEQFGMTGLVLMENAGLRAAEVVLDTLHRIKGRCVCVLAGPGNNGGDGFVVARHLANAGYLVTILLCAPREKYQGDALENLLIAEKMGLSLRNLYSLALPEIASAVNEQVTHADIVVDALLGTGASGPPREPIRTVIEKLNDLNTPERVVALDVPSGLDVDTGKPMGIAVRAGHTVTFAAMKKGFLALEAAFYTGQVTVAAIGIDARLLAVYLDTAEDTPSG